MGVTTPRLRAFFENYYAPDFLIGASPKTTVEYLTSIDHWEALTANPPIAKIDNSQMAAFKRRLLEQPGRRSKTLSPATCNKHLAAVGAILTKAGPRGPRNRDALALISEVPWTRPLKERRAKPRKLTPTDLAAIYRGCDAAAFPRLVDVAPAAWWRALEVTAYNLGFRKGALLRLEWQHVDLAGQAITLPAEFDKCGG